MPRLQMRDQVLQPGHIRHLGRQLGMESRLPLVVLEPDIRAHGIFPAQHEPGQPDTSERGTLAFGQRVLQEAECVAGGEGEDEGGLAPELGEDDLGDPAVDLQQGQGEAGRPPVLSDSPVVQVGLGEFGAGLARHVDCLVRGAAEVAGDLLEDLGGEVVEGEGLCPGVCYDFCVHYVCVV